MRRLRKANTHDEVRALLDEVEMRISKPPRVLASRQTSRRVRQLPSGRPQPGPKF